MTRRALALAATLCSSAPTAYAMEPHDRVVIVGSATSPLVRRLREESEALGFAVTVKLEETDLLADELAGPGVVAAIRLVEQPTESLELVIDDPKLHHVFHDELPIRTTTDPTAAELVATRAIELLRAIRLGALRNPEPMPVTARATAPAIAESAPKLTTAVGVAPVATIAPPFTIGAGADIGATLLWRHLGVDAGIGLPVVSQRLVHVGGDIDASESLIHAAFIARSSARPPLGAGLGLGVEVGHVHFDGKAPAPLVNPGATVFTYGPRFELVATLRVAPHLRVIAPVAASYVLPHTVLRFAGQPVRDWGPLLLRFGAGLEWSWP